MDEMTEQVASIVRVTDEPDRSALERRIRDAKVRLRDDLERASALIRGAARSASRGVLRAVVVGGMVLVGLAIAAVVRRRRGRRIRVVVR